MYRIGPQKWKIIKWRRKWSIKFGESKDLGLQGTASGYFVTLNPYIRPVKPEGFDFSLNPEP